MNNGKNDTKKSSGWTMHGHILILYLVASTDLTMKINDRQSYQRKRE